jgi:hypothetical protein
MNTRLVQDAHDTLTALEAQQAFRNRERARWERAQQAARPCTGSWAPTMTAQQKQQHDQYVIEQNLPF